MSDIDDLPPDHPLRELRTINEATRDDPFHRARAGDEKQVRAACVLYAYRMRQFGSVDGPLAELVLGWLSNLAERDGHALPFKEAFCGKKQEGGQRRTAADLRRDAVIAGRMVELVQEQGLSESGAKFLAAQESGKSESHCLKVYQSWIKSLDDPAND